MGKKRFSKSEAADSFRGFLKDISDYLLRETDLYQLDVTKARKMSDKMIKLDEDLSFFVESVGNQYLLSFKDKNRVVQSVYENKPSALCIYFSTKESGAVCCVDLYSI